MPCPAPCRPASGADALVAGAAGQSVSGSLLRHLQCGRFLRALVLVVGASLLVLVSSSVCAASCGSTTTIGLDTSYVNTGWNVSFGHAIGETFLATETEILSITVWRPWFDNPNGSVWRIFIMGVDSLGTPDVYNIIQNGPTLWIPFGDSLHHTSFRFVFDPPVLLPGSGVYEFAIQGDACQGDFSVAADYKPPSNGDYPDGILWDHGRETFCYYYPRPGPEPRPDADLVFEVEFCRPETPVRPVSWGRIKALYR